MTQSQRILDIEQDLDAQYNGLNIWESSFQQILSVLLLTIETIDRSGRGDTAMDYASRLSYLYSDIT